MSETLKDLKQIEADLLANKAKLIKAQAIEDEKKAEAKLKRDIERRAEESKAYVARQELINLEKSIIPLVKQYANLKRNHISNDFTDKWDAFFADLKGEKKPRKKRITKLEE